MAMPLHERYQLDNIRRYAKRRGWSAAPLNRVSLFARAY
jgi:hypothetical protein